MPTPEHRLAALGIALPAMALPAANYVPFVISGNLLVTSGQLPLKDGKLILTGILGDGLGVSDGQAAARQCAINILALAKTALGELSAIKRLVKVTIFVASAPGFTEQHLAGNGASDLLAAVLGDAGKHARSAVGVASLPLNAPVEIEALFEI